MRIVLRNRGRGRVDAAYILDAVRHDGECALTAYWGPWAQYEQFGWARLRYTVKYRGHKLGLMDVVREVCSEKMRGGYRVVEERSLLPEWPILPDGQDWREIYAG